MAKRSILKPVSPIQDGSSLSLGHAKDPFLPLWLTGESVASEVMPNHLYSVAKKIDSIGNKRDFEDDFDNVVFQIQSNSFGWYKAALYLWKVKLYKAWETDLVGIFKSFREFCERGIGKTVACINSWIRAARCVSLLISSGFDRLPQSVSIALELSKMSDECLVDHWRDLLDRHNDHEISVEKMKALISEYNPDRPKSKTTRLPEDAWEIARELAAVAGLSPTQFIAQLLRGLKSDDTDSQETDTYGDSPHSAIENETLPSSSSFDLSDSPRITDDARIVFHRDAPVQNDGTVSVQTDDGDVSKNLTIPAICEAGVRVARSVRGATLDGPRQFARYCPPLICREDECQRTDFLIACFNTVNFSRVADRYYCDLHLADSGYCRCGRWMSQCDCAEVEEF